MKKLFLILSLCLLTVVGSARIQQVCDEIDLSIKLVDPTKDHKPIKKNPVAIPVVSLEGNSLYFATPCDSCTLRLITEDGDVEYATVIPDGTTSLVLPSYLSGDYEIQIIRGNFCFYGYILL